MPWLLGLAGPCYAVCAGALSLLFTGTAVRVWRDDSERSARQMFAFSLLYLFLIFSALLGRPDRWGRPVTAGAVMDERERRMRARNRALLALLLALVALFYVITLVRIGGG